MCLWHCDYWRINESSCSQIWRIKKVWQVMLQKLMIWRHALSSQEQNVVTNHQPVTGWLLFSDCVSVVTTSCILVVITGVIDKRFEGLSDLGKQDLMCKKYLMPDVTRQICMTSNLFLTEKDGCSCSIFFIQEMHPISVAPLLKLLLTLTYIWWRTRENYSLICLTRC